MDIGVGPLPSTRLQECQEEASLIVFRLLACCLHMAVHLTYWSLTLFNWQWLKVGDARPVLDMMASNLEKLPGNAITARTKLDALSVLARCVAQLQDPSFAEQVPHVLHWKLLFLWKILASTSETNNQLQKCKYSPTNEVFFRTTQISAIWDSRAWSFAIADGSRM